METVNEKNLTGTGTDPILLRQPRRSALRAGHANTLEALVRVQWPAPALGGQPRS